MIQMRISISRPDFHPFHSCSHKSIHLSHQTTLLQVIAFLNHHHPALAPSLSLHRTQGQGGLRTVQSCVDLKSDDNNCGACSNAVRTLRPAAPHPTPSHPCSKTKLTHFPLSIQCSTNLTCGQSQCVPTLHPPSRLLLLRR
jgi:hypothetical protein